MSDYFGFVHDQARYYRCHLSRARSRLPLAKAAPEKTSVGARQAATGTVSEGARLAFCRGFRIAGFASGEADPNAKVRSDCKTEAYADVAQTDADASPQPLMSPQLSGRSALYTNFRGKSFSAAAKSWPVSPCTHARASNG